MTEGSKQVLKFLQNNFGEEFTKQEIAKKLGVMLSTVTGSMNSLIKNGLAITTREEKVVDAEATETRKERFHTLKYHTLTEKGLSYDPIAAEKAAEEEKARKREAAKAAKEAAKAAKEAVEA